MNWAWTVAAIVGSWLAMVCLLLVGSVLLLRRKLQRLPRNLPPLRNPIAAARSLSMELLLPVWRAPPAVTAAAVMGPLAMQRLRLMCRLGFTLPAPSSPSLSLGKMTTRLHDWVGSVRVSSLGEDGSWLVDVGRQFEKVDEVDGGTGSKCRHRGRVVQCVGLKQHCGSHCRTVYELC